MLDPLNTANRREKTGTGTSTIGVIIYLLANWSYTIAVFTPPGSPAASSTTSDGYGLLPTSQGSNTRPATSFTVKSNGEHRFCKKCQSRKPDRTHHCSTCRRCVLKMDHHCPWLATCVGLRNYKAFLLFLCYTTMLCGFAFMVTGTWVYDEILFESNYMDTLMPINYIMLCVFSGIIGFVLALFTGWHIMLSLRGQTTIECLEQTRYLSPLRKPYAEAHNPANHLPAAAQTFVDMHTNALPGITRPEEGEERSQTHYVPGSGGPPAPVIDRSSYAEREHRQSMRRYEEYLDEQDSQKLPNAFDLGWKRNMLHLLGPSPWLWFIPIMNTTGDGWSWDGNPAFLEMLAQMRQQRQQQRQREINAGWGSPDMHTGPPPQIQRNYLTKADKILGRDANVYADAGPAATVPLRNLSTRGKTVEQELDDLDNDFDDFDDQPQSQIQSQVQSKKD